MYEPRQEPPKGCSIPRSFCGLAQCYWDLSFKEPFCSASGLLFGFGSRFRRPTTKVPRGPPPDKSAPKSAAWFEPKFGDKFGESLRGSQATPSFWKVPGLPRKFPKLPRKFCGDFPGSSHTVELDSNPGVPRSFPDFPEVPQTSPEVSRTSPEVSRTSPEVSPVSGKPDSQKTF